MATSAGSGLLDLRDDQVHGFHLSDAERAPAAADEAEHEAAIGQQVGGTDQFSVVIMEFELGRFRSDGQDVRREILLFQFIDGLCVDFLRFCRDVLRDEFFALGVDVAQRTKVSRRGGFFQGTPLHSWVAITVIGILRLRCRSLRSRQLRSG